MIKIKCSAIRIDLSDKISAFFIMIKGFFGSIGSFVVYTQYFHKGLEIQDIEKINKTVWVQVPRQKNAWHLF